MKPPLPEYRPSTVTEMELIYIHNLNDKQNLTFWANALCFLLVYILNYKKDQTKFIYCCIMHIVIELSFYLHFTRHKSV